MRAGTAGHGWRGTLPQRAGWRAPATRRALSETGQRQFETHLAPAVHRDIRAAAYAALA
jgi:hypothetical protein